jgi:cell division protein FtsQ
MGVLLSPEQEKKLSSIKQRHRQLLSRGIWRSAVVISFAGTLLCTSNSSYWQIQHQSQIKIVGENLITEDIIDQILDFTYPQFIWSINSGKLTKKLEVTPSVAAVKITRQIIPPRLTISIKERIPVALALWSGKIGFLDAQGKWIAQNFYGDISPKFPLPPLKVVNYQPQYRTNWVDIYNSIVNYSQLQIQEVRWDESGNVFLKTEIGLVHLGSDLSRLKEQFEIMVRLKNLPTYIEISKIAYIDLSNPNLNSIQKYQQK